MLTCRLNPSIGFIIAGHQSMECRFNPNDHTPQAMRGPSIRLGSTLAYCRRRDGLGRIRAHHLVPAGALAGDMSASVRHRYWRRGRSQHPDGGSGRTIALQPVSLEGSVAVNVALGVSGLKLRPAF